MFIKFLEHIKPTFCIYTPHIILVCSICKKNVSSFAHELVVNMAYSGVTRTTTTTVSAHNFQSLLQGQYQAKGS